MMVLSFTMTAPNLRLRHVLRLATLRAMSRKYMVLSGRSMSVCCVLVVFEGYYGYVL